MEKKSQGENKTMTDNAFDAAVSITPYRIRYYTIGIILVILVLFIWGFFGSIPIKMKASGMITTISSVNLLSSKFDGIVYEIYKTRGDTVHKGDKLIKLTQIDLNYQLKDQLEMLSQQINIDSLQIEILDNEKELQIKLFSDQNEDLILTMEQTKNEIVFYRKLFSDSKLLLDKGIISNTQYEQTLFQLQRLELSYVSDSVNRVLIANNRKIYIDKVEIKKRQIRINLADLKEQTNSMADKFKIFSYITANSKGVIQECLVKNGIAIAQYQNVFTIQEISNLDSNLYVDLFIPYYDMEKAEVNMKAATAPFNVDQNRYGKIESIITEVTFYPASDAFILNIIGNSDAVKTFTEKGPVYYARAILLTDTTTVSGLKWTSKKGPPFKITAGMSCEVDIYAADYPPISFIIPFIKKGLNDEY